MCIHISHLIISHYICWIEGSFIALNFIFISLPVPSKHKKATSVFSKMLNCHLFSFSAICYILGYPQCAPKSLIFAFTTLNASPSKADYSHYSSTISSISYLLKVQFIMVTQPLKNQDRR